MITGTRRISICIGLAAVVLAGCSSEPVTEFRVVDTMKNRMVILRGEQTALRNYYRADFAVLGGGMGGIAAALSICSAGRSVILVEETDQVAGCFASDDTTYIAESRFTPTSGASRTFHEFRERIMEWYDSREREQPRFDFGLEGDIADFSNGDFCFESDAAIEVIEDMLAQNIESGKLTVLRRLKPARAVTFHNRLASIQAVHLDSMAVDQIAAWMFVDATRTGYLYPLAGIGHSPAIDPATLTGEAPAPADTDSLWNVFYVPHHDTPRENEEYENVVVEPLSPERTETHTDPVRVLREPLHLEARYMIGGNDITEQANEPPRAKFFRDSVGIGYTPIVVDSNGGRTVIPTLPFQIPLRSLVPVTFTNVLAGGWSLGAMPEAGGAFRSPLVEWSIGEAAGEAGAYCAGYRIYLDKLIADPGHIRALQEWLVARRGAPIYWYSDVSPGDDDFEEAQMRPFIDPDYHEELEERQTLRYHPGGDRGDRHEGRQWEQFERRNQRR